MRSQCAALLGALLFGACSTANDQARPKLALVSCDGSADSAHSGMADTLYVNPARVEYLQGGGGATRINFAGQNDYADVDCPAAVVLHQLTQAGR